MHPGAPAVVVSSDLVSSPLCIKMTAAERKFIERQAQLELRTLSNYVRSLIIERMSA